MRAWPLLAAAAAAAFACAAGGDAPVPAQYVFTSTPQYEPSAWVRGKERFPQGAAVVVASGDIRRPVAAGFVASADPSVSFDGSRILFSGKNARGAHWQVWEAALAGGSPKQVTRCTADCISPLYRPGGEIVYTRLGTSGSDIEISQPDGTPRQLTFAPGWRLTDDVLRDGRILFENDGELYTVYPDGTGVESFRCDHGPHRSAARQVSSGDVVFNAAGKLALFSPALASQSDVKQPDMEIAGPVAESAPGTWIIPAKKPGEHYGLYLWSRITGSLSKLESNAVQPSVIRSRVPPKEFPSALVPTRTTGNLLCLNARDSKRPFPRDVQTVQVSTLNAAGLPVVLGKQKVARDGSFYVEVPAGRPLRIELLDEAGKTVQGEAGWFWMRPSEQRVCVGCHLGPERAPENKVPEILLETIVPAKLLEQTK